MSLRWGAHKDIVSLDPYSYGDTFTISVLAHAYEGLVRYDEKLKIQPSLATSWEVLSPSVWRFHLREGVKFHNGDPFTADDVHRLVHPRQRPGLAAAAATCPPTSPRKSSTTTRSMSRSPTPTRCCSTT